MKDAFAAPTVVKDAFAVVGVVKGPFVVPTVVKDAFAVVGVVKEAFAAVGAFRGDGSWWPAGGGRGAGCVMCPRARGVRPS